MRQILDEIKCLRVARSALKGEMVDLIHRLANQEEEILRSELRTATRERRATVPHDKAGLASQKLATIALPDTNPETAAAKADTPRSKAEVSAFTHFVRELSSSSNPHQALFPRKIHKLQKRETRQAWDGEVDMEFRPASSMLPADQPGPVTPSTPISKDTKTPADDNGPNQAHSCLLYTSPSPRDS